MINKNSLFQNKKMSNLTWFGVGGFSKYYFQPSSEEDLISFLKDNDLNLPIYPLGAGSNIIIRDRGFNGIIVHFNKLKDISIDNKGIIIIHDCLPKKIWNQIVPRMYGHWNGDVWKAIVHARTYEYADTYTLKADHGLGIIFKRKNKNPLKLNPINFKKLKFADYYNNHEKFMNIIDMKNLEKIF